MAALVVCLAVAAPCGTSEMTLPAPARESLRYAIEWRLFTAGAARLDWSHGDSGVDTNLHITSTGLVSKLFRVDDRYTAHLTRELCAQSAFFKAEEGFRRRETRITFDQAARTATYLERDVAKNTTILAKEIPVPPCVMDVIGALYRLRQLDVPLGKSVEVPVSDGKKAVMARVEAQVKETVKTKAGDFHAIRYEAFLFNDVLYKRAGRLLLWVTDDGRRIPVQIQARMQLHIGTITVQLEKYEP